MTYKSRLVELETKHVGTIYIAYIKLFLRKSSIIFVLNRKKANSIFMKGNSIFSKCALKEHLKNVAYGLADS